MDIESLNQLISKKLKGLRAENLLSLESVAKQLNIHRETLRRYENNPKLMSIDFFVKLLNCYEIKANIFFEDVNGKLP